jgi:hypothetical protein
VSTSAEVLIEEAVSDESVLSRIAHCVEREASARTTKNKASNALREAEKATEAATQFAAEYWSRSRQVEMNLTVGGTEPEPE